MNALVKFTVYRLQVTEGSFRQRLGVKVARYLLLAAALFGGMTARAQTYYVFYNSTAGYIINNNGSLDVSTTFTPSAVWITSGALANNNNNLRSMQSYTNTSLYFVDNDPPAIANAAGTNRWSPPYATISPPYTHHTPTIHRPL